MGGCWKADKIGRGDKGGIKKDDPCLGLGDASKKKNKGGERSGGPVY